MAGSRRASRAGSTAPPTGLALSSGAILEEATAAAPQAEIVVNTSANTPSSSQALLLPNQPAPLVTANLQTELQNLRYQKEIMDLKAALAAETARAAIPTDDDGESHGKSYSPIVISIARSIPGVAYEDVDSILKDTFKVARLAYLRQKPYDPEDDVTVATIGKDGRVREHKVARTAQYGNLGGDLFAFAECLSNYQIIYGGLFQEQHFKTCLALSRFISFLLTQGQIYTSKACIEYGLAAFASNLPDRHNPEVWTTPMTHWVTAYFKEDYKRRRIDSSAGQPLSKKSRGEQSDSSGRPWASPDWDKSICFGHNHKPDGCGDPGTCRYAHKCSKCKATGHGALTCRNK